ncbi:uncharacterized protein LOC113515625 isoform X2 [Galleria mellonella]|uniref:Uncharacterized protein LOC113515625 isoform X2 n=1 Tax=Galleria mellonella TaxID=7137 RepID=A0ABM3MD87_GALME|nr:uncharacterized protein LOC113515625 isoform X2 [Galleria mellonella]
MSHLAGICQTEQSFSGASNMISRSIQFLCCICIILLLYRNVVHAEEVQTYKITDTVSFCSSKLSVMISKLCDNQYKIVKRDTSILIGKLSPRRLEEQEFAKERWRRLRRQVANECCNQPCSLENLIMYCSEDAKFKRIL